LEFRNRGRREVSILPLLRERTLIERRYAKGRLPSASVIERVKLISVSRLKPTLLERPGTKSLQVKGKKQHHEDEEKRRVKHTGSGRKKTRTYREGRGVKRPTGERRSFISGGGRNFLLCGEKLKTKGRRTRLRGKEKDILFPER